MDIKQGSIPSATGLAREAPSVPHMWPERFSPGELYYVAALTGENGWAAYCEVRARTPSGDSATAWSAGKGAPVTAYSWEFPNGTYDELYESDDETLLVRLTPEQFAKVRLWHWPDLTDVVWRAVEWQTEWLEALDGGRDGIHVERWEEFCQESFCTATLLEAVQRLLSGDQPPIPVLTARPVSPGVYHIWCRYCETWHEHRSGSGHQGAQCPNATSPYRHTGYILRSLG
jgi:hypothetical protein